MTEVNVDQTGASTELVRLETTMVRGERGSFDLPDEALVRADAGTLTAFAMVAGQMADELGLTIEVERIPVMCVHRFSWEPRA